MAAPHILAAASPGFETLLGALGTQGYRVHYQPSPAQARKALARQSFDLLLVEADGSRPEGLALARLALRRTPPVPVILLSRPDRPLPAAAFALEAADYLQWPEPLPAAIRRVDRCLGRPSRRSRAEAERRVRAFNARAFCLIRDLASVCHLLLQALAPEAGAEKCPRPPGFEHSGQGPGVADLCPTPEPPPPAP
ncbi:MAG: hypothetical protein K6T55_07000 [Syntrophobacterales bacterium]|nr:hypothetical protein [Syntrophobacterales bacterium]